MQYKIAMTETWIFVIDACKLQHFSLFLVLYKISLLVWGNTNYFSSFPFPIKCIVYIIYLFIYYKYICKNVGSSKTIGNNETTV